MGKFPSGIPEVVPPGITMHGINDFNNAPTPIEPLDPDQFWKKVAIWGWGNSQSHHQVKSLPDMPQGGLRGLNIFWYYDHALAIYVDGHNQPHFYYIGCKHSDIETYSTNRGYHCGHCQACGRKYSYDSGD